MNDNNSTTETTVSERLSDSRLLSMQWKTIDWKKAEQEVNRLQVRIVKATQEKKWNAVKRLQYLLTHSFYAKALAVRRVTTNKGKENRRCGRSNLVYSCYEDEGCSIIDRQRLQSKTVTTCLYRKER